MGKGVANVLYGRNEYFGRRHEVTIPFMLTIGKFIFGKHEQVYHISCIELNRDGVYLTFPLGTALHEGEIFRIVRSLGSYKYDYFSFGCPGNVVANVKVVKIENNCRVLVQVVKGTVVNGVSAERGK